MTSSTPGVTNGAAESGSQSWPVQTKQYPGQDRPQDPATLPVSRDPSLPLPATARPRPSAPLTMMASGRWKVGAWRFVAQSETHAPPEEISSPGFADGDWLTATVPGTVLTSYIDNGVFADPAYGLNNLLIPERLARQDYWYRTEFTLPDNDAQRLSALNFEGINYAAEIWVNGKRLGTIVGAFIRGRFPLDERLRPGARVAVAIRVSPPPHPGLAQEESLAAGPGQNGGAMAVDGPTFAASEGWDWIPTVRDRETGIWQDVVLEETGAVRLGDPHVRSVLPKPDNRVAELTITVPVINQGETAVAATVSALLGRVTLAQTVKLAPRSSQMVTFAPSRFRALRIVHPDLWWPNGYGKPTLHRLKLTASTGGAASDERDVRYGIREISYEVSALDSAKALQRVAVIPDRSPGERLLDVRHEMIRKVEGGWAVSLARAIDGSPALAPVSSPSLTPHLLIRVNGVPIAVRGGNWGMDDWLKRVSRDRMEPYFRLHQQANVNTIRNWLGQSTEQVFYDLADEYGLLVLNDFWISTQDHNGEPADNALFMANASDTIGRFQYHPSIALWIGRNEGVPPPMLNVALDQAVRQIDGTRLYLPNSRLIEMANSGPWNYQPPESYFTRLARGFSTEVGTPSFPTLETFKAMMPSADQWPISDSWAYHDWHQAKAGDVKSFMKALTERFGAPADLADFEKKAQLLNYESHRAIFEGMNDGLFVRNSGRLLWMTHPAWPSTLWQIYSHNYDTQASYFGFKKGTEPVHVQLNLPGREVAVVNSLANTLARARVRIRNYRLDGALLSDQSVRIDAAALATTATGNAIDATMFDRSPVVLTKLELFDARGAPLSENVYWLARDPSAYSAMTSMPPAKVTVRARQTADTPETEIRVTVLNDTTLPALMVRLSALDAAGARVLPAYWSDNYVSLLPGETRTVTLQLPASAARPASIRVDGWNVENASIPVAIASGPTGGK
ncbi:MAG: glycoside hydrolase family 2 [Sphingomonas sp. 28-66-16]|nr:MAG: glycoside hydrolase family 2 [Sphingomonas sp. 28-66-16]